MQGQWTTRTPEPAHESEKGGTRPANRYLQVCTVSTIKRTWEGKGQERGITDSKWHDRCLALPTRTRSTKTWQVRGLWTGGCTLAGAKTSSHLQRDNRITNEMKLHHLSMALAVYALEVLKITLASNNSAPSAHALRVSASAASADPIFWGRSLLGVIRESEYMLKRPCRHW